MFRLCHFLLLATLLSAHVGAQSAKRDPLDAYRLRINAWDVAAKLVRSAKELKEVKKGTRLEVADVVATGPKKGVEVYAGAVGVQSIKKDTVVKYVSIDPPSLDPLKKSDLLIEVKKGEIQHRTGKLATGSLYRSRSGPRLAASTGTAYAVVNKGNDLEVVVAEGQVQVSFDAKPDKPLTIDPRQKALIGNALPAAAVPVADDDEARIRDLLSIRVDPLIGYGDPKNLTRKDATEIVTLYVRPALKIERSTFAKAKFDPMSVVVDGDSFRTVDDRGEQHLAGEGLKFIDATKNGSAIIGQNASGDLVAVDLMGVRRQFLMKAPAKLVSLAPNGSRAVVDLESTRTEFVSADSDEKHKVAVHQRWVVSIGSPSYRLLQDDSAGNVDFIWAAGGRRLFAVFKKGATQSVVNPEAGPAHFADVETVQKTNLLTVEASAKVEVSPSGDWVYSLTNGAVDIAYTPSGARLHLDGVASLHENFGSGTLTVLGTDGKGREVQRPTEDEIKAVPTDDEAKLKPGPFYAVSPNGELVTFRDPKTRTAIVADSIDLNRRSDTFVGIPSDSKCEWVAGDEVYYGAGRSKDFSGDLLIKLGVKRVGAVTSEFTGDYRPSWVDQPQAFDASVLDFATEIVVTDVAADGTVVGFTKRNSKTTGSGAFIVPGGSRTAVSLGDNTYFPMYVTDDGLVVGNYFAKLPDGRLVKPVIPYRRGQIEGVSSDGKVLIIENLPDPLPNPDAKGHYHQSPTRAMLWEPMKFSGSPGAEPGEPVVGGTLTPVSPVVPNASAVGMNRNGEVLWMEHGDQERHKLWLGKPGSIPTLIKPYTRYMAPIMGDDGSFIVQSGSSTGNGPMVYKVIRVTADGQATVLYSGPDELQVMGVTKEGYVYGSDLVQQPEGYLTPEHAYVLVNGKRLGIADLLGPGYKMTQFRRVTPRGEICGSIYFNGKPVILTPILGDLLKKAGY